MWPLTEVSECQTGMKTINASSKIVYLPCSPGKSYKLVVVAITHCINYVQYQFVFLDLNKIFEQNRPEAVWF